MINFLLKYLGVYGLLGMVAVAIIVPTFIVYNNIDDSQSKNGANSAEKIPADSNTEQSSTLEAKSETNKEESFYVQVFAGPVTASVQVNFA